MNGGWGISYEIALIWTSLDLSDDKSTLVQVMAWCRQATSHYLSQFWPSSLPPCGVTRPQWVNTFYPGATYVHKKNLGHCWLGDGLGPNYLNQSWLIINKTTLHDIQQMKTDVKNQNFFNLGNLLQIFEGNRFRYDNFHVKFDIILTELDIHKHY